MLRTYAHDAAVVGESGPKSTIQQAIQAAAVQNETHVLRRICLGNSASAEVVLDSRQQPSFTFPDRLQPIRRPTLRLKKLT